MFEKGNVPVVPDDVEMLTHPVDRFYRKNTRKTAIDAFCANCMGEEMVKDPAKRKTTPGYRSSIRNCTAVNCPLYDWRPYK